MLFSSLFGRGSRSSKPDPEGRPRRRTIRKGSFQPSLESLEDRNLLSAGMLNPHFGTGGKALINFGANPIGYLSSFVVQPDGTTLLAGSVQDLNRIGSLGTLGQVEIAVAKLTKDGSLDPRFGTGGETIIDLPPHFDLGGGPNIAVRPDGTILLEAISQTVVRGALNGTEFLTVAALNKDGTPISSFGSGGVTLVPFMSPYTMGAVYGNFIALPNGKIIFGGNFATSSDGTTNSVIVVQLTKDGSLDRHFGTGGETIVNANIFGDNIQWNLTSTSNGTPPFNPIAVLTDGTIVLTGQATTLDQNSNPSAAGIAVVELTKDGRLNDNFGQGGRPWLTSVPPSCTP